MSKLPPNDASVLAFMAQDPYMAPKRLLAFRKLLSSTEGKSVAKAMIRSAARKKISAKQIDSDATLTADGLRQWAKGNRYTISKPKASLSKTRKRVLKAS